MRQPARVTVTMQELDRLKCIQAVVDGDLQPIRAAERLGLTTRQVRRLAVRYRREGPVGVISKRRNPARRSLAIHYATPFSGRPLMRRTWPNLDKSTG
jgi:hypothetical protein